MTDLSVLEFVQKPSGRDADQLISLCREARMEVNWILEEQRENRLQIWRAGKGLVVTQLLPNESGRELFVLGIVGRGILRALPKIADDLRVVGKSFGCSTIGGNSLLRPGFEKLYTALGALPVYTYYSMEII